MNRVNKFWYSCKHWIPSFILVFTINHLLIMSVAWARVRLGFLTEIWHFISTIFTFNISVSCQRGNSLWGRNRHGQSIQNSKYSNKNIYLQRNMYFMYVYRLHYHWNVKTNDVCLPEKDYLSLKKLIFFIFI